MCPVSGLHGNQGCPGEAPPSTGPHSRAQENRGASSRVEDLDAGLTAAPTASPGSFPVSPSSDCGPGTAPEALLTRVGRWAHGTPACLTSNSSPSRGRAETAWLRCPKITSPAQSSPMAQGPLGTEILSSGRTFKHSEVTSKELAKAKPFGRGQV